MLRALAWELPQTALGAAVYVTQALRGAIRVVSVERGCVFVEVDEGAVSLGRLVFYSRNDSRYVPVGEENRDHEYGHAVQSRRWGPLYLPVVGVTSALRVLYAVAWRATHETRWSGYYEGFPEDEADRLGGVDRSLRPAP
jgi:hypothetical protein